MGENICKSIDKGLIDRIYKEPPQIDKKNKLARLKKKWAKNLKRHLFREDMQMTNKFMNRFLTSLVIREMQV
jgi:hypothetical protein